MPDVFPDRPSCGFGGHYFTKHRWRFFSLLQPYCGRCGIKLGGRTMSREQQAWDDSFWASRGGRHRADA